MKNTFILFIISHESSSSSFNQKNVYSNLPPNIINLCYVYFNLLINTKIKIPKSSINPKLKENSLDWKNFKSKVLFLFWVGFLSCGVSVSTCLTVAAFELCFSVVFLVFVGFFSLKLLWQWWV